MNRPENHSEPTIVPPVAYEFRDERPVEQTPSPDAGSVDYDGTIITRPDGMRVRLFKDLASGSILAEDLPPEDVKLTISRVNGRHRVEADAGSSEAMERLMHASVQALGMKPLRPLSTSTSHDLERFGSATPAIAATSSAVQSYGPTSTFDDMMNTPQSPDKLSRRERKSLQFAAPTSVNPAIYPPEASLQHTMVERGRNSMNKLIYRIGVLAIAFAGTGVVTENVVLNARTHMSTQIASTFTRAHKPVPYTFDLNPLDIFNKGSLYVK